MKIQLDIKNCSKCPNVKEDRVYYADSFDCHDVKMTCTKTGTVIGVRDHRWTPKIPDNCPIKVS